MSLATAHTLVIGYGNSLRGDDGLGPFIANLVREQGWPGVQVLIVPQLTPELACQVASFRRVVFVDARRDRLHEAVEVRRLDAATSLSALGHHSAPGTLLALARALEDAAPESWWITVAGADFELREQLSPLARENARTALAKLGQILDQHRAPAY